MEKNGQVVVLDRAQAESHIEKVMQQLNPNDTDVLRKRYLGAVIDTMKDFGHITPETRDTLYPIYAN